MGDIDPGLVAFISGPDPDLLFPGMMKWIIRHVGCRVGTGYRQQSSKDNHYSFHRGYPSPNPALIAL
jgi:hypothetical protein